MEDLDKLCEIGPVQTQAIIDGRPYNKIEDLMKVKGIRGASLKRSKPT
jgi:competence protein ComEA